MSSLIWAVLFVAATLLMVALVPRQQVAEFLQFGLVGGLGVALLILVVFVPFLEFWRFAPPDLLTIEGIPLFMAMAAIPLSMIFARSLTKGEGLLPFLVVLGFPLAATFIHYMLIINGNLAYRNWSLAKTFLLALVTHAALAAYILANFRRKIGIKED
ncbi:MAG: hypothetical protein ACOY9Y_01280 [Bacillota bacterium]